MRYLILLLTTFFMVGCYDDSNNPISSTSNVNISGKVNLSNAGGIDASSITVILGDLTTHPNSDGTYLLSGNVSKVAARTSSALDTVKIIVLGDTLIEIPVNSWNETLPTNYIVQRNISCIVPKTYAGTSVQAVFWDNDSIANVLNLGKGTTDYKFSGFIYTVYNDDQFKANAKVYDIFARVKRNDSVVAYTEISEVSAKVGNVDFDSTQFIKTEKRFQYLYTTIPNDSNVNKFDDTIYKTLVVDTILDTIEYTIDELKTRKYSDDSLFVYYDYGVRYFPKTKKMGDSCYVYNSEFIITYNSAIDTVIVLSRYSGIGPYELTDYIIKVNVGENVVENASIFNPTMMFKIDSKYLSEFKGKHILKYVVFNYI